METPSAWKKFRRMQTSLALAAILAYAACALEAWRLPHAPNLPRTAMFSAGFFMVTLAAALWVPMLRTAIQGHLMTSYRTGFGQGLVSVAVSLTIILAAAVFLLWRIHGPEDPAPAFSAFAAGIGLLVAQVVLVRRLERGRPAR
jgi:hypothetical protein